MNIKNFIRLFIILLPACAIAQTGNIALIEEFTETGCGACAEYDSSFQALTNANADKVAVINYHCFYSLDTFYVYNKACDKRYGLYDLSGFPSAAANGMKPLPTSGHLSYINQSLINKLYNTTPQFKINISSNSANKDSTHITKIKVTTTALKDIPGKDLRLLIAITENNINHEKRYHAKSVNGVNEFNHILRSFLPDIEGSPIGDQKKGKTKTVKVTFTNDEKEMDYKEVRIVAFIQDAKTHEVLGTTVTKEHPFK